MGKIFEEISEEEGEKDNIGKEDHINSEAQGDDINTESGDDTGDMDQSQPS